MVFLKEFFEKVDFERKSWRRKSMIKTVDTGAIPERIFRKDWFWKNQQMTKSMKNLAKSKGFAQMH